jgi:hypothetical protein
VEVIKIEDDDDEEDAAQGDGQPRCHHKMNQLEMVPPPPMGWNVKVYHKPGCDIASHH